MSPRWLPLAIAIALIVSVARAGEPTAEERRQRAEAAVKLHDEAHLLYEHGEYRAAITKLEAAHALDPEGKELVYNLALIHEKIGDLDEAEAYYRRYLEMESDPKNREHVQTILKRIDGAKHEVKIAGSETPPPPPPPLLTVAPSSAPLAPVPPSRRPISAWVWASGGLAATAFVLSGVFAIEAASKNPGSGATTGGGVGIDDLEARATSAHRHAVLADVSFAVGALAGSAALFLYLTTPVPKAHARPRQGLARWLAVDRVRVTF